MTREGAGFLADLAVLWATVTACLIAADVVVSQLGRPWGTIAAIAVSLVIVFGVLVAYYRVYLDERPLLGTADRSRFAILSLQLVIVGFVIGVLFGPTDRAAQTVLLGPIILGGIGIAYWVVYRHGVAESSTTP